MKRLSRRFDDKTAAFASLVWENLNGFNVVAFSTRRKI